ncbi:MAG: hypothetical protein DMG70_26890 [Acidobacteria bacterium]|nr:MAG: hypothetical protein DMG70_26890 [Acidobacteriota bacterium]PYY11968.1 MAG: hypothetical protein DMG69_02730 [Acidobacteriota bacterium]
MGEPTHVGGRPPGQVAHLWKRNTRETRSATPRGSFPGESWSFTRRDRIAEREGDIKVARTTALSWRMKLRDVHLKGGCEISGIAAVYARPGHFGA